MIQRMQRDREGFTLIELVVVVAILGILAVIVTPKVLGAMDNAKKNSNQASAKQIQVAMERYASDNNSYPTPVTFCGTGATSPCTPTLANIETALKPYIDLTQSNLDAPTSGSYTFTASPSDYSLTLSFKNTSTSVVITPNSIQ